MNSRKGLSAREEYLIWAAVILALGLLYGFFLMKPMMTMKTDTRAVLDTRETEERLALAKLSQLNDLNDTADRQLEEIDEYNARYIPLSTVEDLEFSFTEFLLRNGLMPNVIDIKSVEEIYLDGSSEQKDSGWLGSLGLSVQAAGDRNTLFNMIEHVNANQSYRMQSASFSEGSGESKATGLFELEVVLTPWE